MLGLWARGAALILILAIFGPGRATATLYRDMAPGKIVDATAGDERDLFAITGPLSSFSSGSAGDPEGWVTVRLVSQAAQPLTAIVYDADLVEVARFSSDTGAINFPARLGKLGIGYLRIVPTGGRFDSVPGTKFRRSASESFQNRNTLPAYRIGVGSGKGDASNVASAALAAGTPPPAGATASFTTRAEPRPAQSAKTAAAASPMAAGSAGPVDPKRWGMLAQMAGTTWTDSDSVYAIDWITPNAAMLIKRTGLWGDEEILVTPSTDGKGLLYRRNVPDKREEAEGVAPAGGGRFALKYDAMIRETCKLSKGLLVCEGSRIFAGKSSDLREQFSPVSRAQGAALVAAQPGVFPERPQGWFDLKLGLFADAAGGRWELSHTKQQGKWAKTAGGLALEVGAGQASDGMVVHIASTILGTKSLLFKESKADGKLYASVSAANHKNPEGRSNVQLVTRDNGRSAYCYVYYEQTYCDYWSLSKDGRMLLVSGSGYAFALSQVDAPKFAAGQFGLLASLNEKSFQSPSGEIMSFTVYGEPGKAASGASIYYYQDGEATGYCGTNATQGLDCTRYARRNNTTYKVTLTAANAREFTRDGATFTLDAGGNLVSRRPNQAPVLHRRLTWGDLRHIEQAKSDNDRIRYAYNDRRMRKESSDAVWRGIAQGVAEFGNTYRAAQQQNSFLAPVPLPVRSNPQAGVGGYQSMGTITRVQAPQQSLAERYRTEELERFKVREQIYGGSGGGGSPAPAAKPYAKAYEQLARDQADSKARSEAAEIEAKAREQARTDTAAKEDAIEQQAQKAAGQARARRQDAVKGSTARPAALTVRSADPAEQRRMAEQEADRQRYLAGEADRAAKARAAEAAAKAEYAKAEAERARADAEIRRMSPCVLPMDRRPDYCPKPGNKPPKAKAE